jgi:hypothetical protein
MAKENTHILFAHTVLDHFRETDIIREISAHIDYYYLGSIIPDTFYYSSDNSVKAVSETLHGKNGNLTNTYIFKVLDGSGSMNDIAFILGYITHCALDITVHPVIYYLTGNYYDSEPERRHHTVYLHRLIETCLDEYLDNPLRIYDLVHTSLLKGLIFENIIHHDFSISTAVIRRTLKKQLFSNRLFTNTLVYRCADILNNCRLIKGTDYLGLFYRHAQTHNNCLSDPIAYRDIITGVQKASSIKDLMNKARKKAVEMMMAAYDYSQGNISKDQLSGAVPGESLDTGMVNISTKDIQFTYTGEETCKD